MKKKGFTLIELLAVIIILAVIALIATPLIMGTITKAKKNAFKDTVYGILKAGENYAAEELLKGSYEGEIIDLKTSNRLKYKGTKPEEGSLELFQDGSMALYIKHGDNCYIKRKNKSEVEVIEHAKECSLRVSKNLVKNGYLEYGNNTNFPGFKFENGKLVYQAIQVSNIEADEFIPISKDKKYKLSMKLKSSDEVTKHHLGLVEYDKDRLEIVNLRNLLYVENSTTVLKKELKNGDTKIYFDNISNFMTNDKSALFSNGLIFWDYKDSTGYLYPPETYSQNGYTNLFDVTGIDKINHTITLRKPWAYGTFPEGTSVSQLKNGNARNYCLLAFGVIPMNETTYEVTVQVTDNYQDQYQLYLVTNYIRPFFVLNRSGTGTSEVTISQVVIEEV